MRALAVALVLVLAIVAIVLAGFGPGSDDVAPQPLAGPIEDTVVPATETAEAPHTGDAGVGDAAAIDRESIRATPMAPYIFRVRVVRAPSLQPFPGARLWATPESLDPQRWPTGHLGRWNQDPEPYLAAEGRTWLCDGDGRITIGNAHPRIALAARDGEWYGANTFQLEADATDGEVLLFLAKDETLVFRALDSAGEPVAGIFARCTFLAREGRGSANEVRVGPSDASGRMRIPHIQINRYSAGGASTAEARVVVFGSAPPSERIALEPTPVEPVVLRVPDSAALDVVCLGRDGKPWTLLEGEFDQVAVSRGGRDPAESFVKLERDGTARVWPVLCDTELTVSWFSFGAKATVRAPLRKGESLRVELIAQKDRNSLRGRLLDRSGQPQRGTFWMTLELAPRPDLTIVATGADGRFRYLLEERRYPSPLRIRICAMPDPPLADAGCAGIERIEPLQPGANDLGDVVLGPRAELLVLRVEWQDGSPVLEPKLRMHGPEFRKGFDDPTLVKESLGDGRHVVRGAPSIGTITVGAEHPEAQTPVEATFAEGSGPAVIRMMRGGSLMARCLVDADVPWEEFEFSLRREGPGAGPSDRVVVKPEHASRAGPAVLRWSGVSDGRYTLAVAAVPGERPFREVPGLELRAGAQSSDERLREIDLRGAVHRLELRLTDELGAPLPAGKVLVLRRVPEGSVGWYGHLVQDGLAVLAVDRPVDLRVGARGYRMEELFAVARDVQVRIARVPRVRLRVAAEIPRGTALGIELVPEPESWRGGVRYQSRAGAGDGQWDFGWHETGITFHDAAAEKEWRPAHETIWLLRLRVSIGTTMADVELPAPLTIDTRGLRPDAVVTITPDPEALARALAKLPR